MYDLKSIREKVRSECKLLGTQRAVAAQYKVHGKPLNQFYISALLNNKPVPKHILQVLAGDERLRKNLIDEKPADVLEMLQGRYEMPPIIPELRDVLETL